MIIKTIKIQHYRSCLDTVFHLDKSLSVLIGPNGTGKTNILSAIQLINNIVKFISRRFIEQKEQGSECKIKVWYDVNGKILIHTIDLEIYTEDSNRDEIISAKEKWYIKNITPTRNYLVLSSELIRAFISEPGHRGVPLRYRGRFFPKNQTLTR